jgi:hypothetical protein
VYVSWRTWIVVGAPLRLPQMQERFGSVLIVRCRLAQKMYGRQPPKRLCSYLSGLSPVVSCSS